MILMDMMTIRQIKQQSANMAAHLAVPQFWITDWLLTVIDKPALFLMTDEDYKLTVSESERFNAGIADMRQGVPLAYLTGVQEFWSLAFKVNEYTLIPRPDTEVLVEQTLSLITHHASRWQNRRLLDLGTGSGCIAISLAHELAQADWQVVAVDLSAEALDVACHNARANQVNNIEFVQGSWYDGLPMDSDSSCLFDVIVSNPPYIDEADIHLSRLTAEPISALSAPHQGLADIEQIVHRAPSYLNQKGLLAIEHGFEQGEAVRQIFLNNGFEAIKTIRDYGGNERVTLGFLAVIESQS